MNFMGRLVERKTRWSDYFIVFFAVLVLKPHVGEGNHDCATENMLAPR